MGGWTGFAPWWHRHGTMLGTYPTNLLARRRRHGPSTTLSVWVALVCGMASLACTYEEENPCAVDGSCQCPDAEVDEAGRPPPMRYVLITDTSDLGREPWSYTAGIDVCGVVAECDGHIRFGRTARLLPGYRGACTRGEDCASLPAREDPQAVLDDGARCGLEGPQSDFVSLGASGYLVIDFVVDLRGCTIRLYEFDEQDGGDEWFRMFVCDSEPRAGCDCATHLYAQPAGDITVEVPP